VCVCVCVCVCVDADVIFRTWERGHPSILKLKYRRSLNECDVRL